MNGFSGVLFYGGSGLKRVPADAQASRTKRLSPLHQQADRRRIVEEMAIFGSCGKLSKLASSRVRKRKQQFLAVKHWRIEMTAVVAVLHFHGSGSNAPT